MKLQLTDTTRRIGNHHSRKIWTFDSTSSQIHKLLCFFFLHGTRHLTCLLKNLYTGQEATVRTEHGTTDWFQIGKGVRQGCILSPCFLTYMQSTSWETLSWRKHKLESRLLGEISITPDMQMTPPLWQKWRTEEPLDESERGEWKSWLKTQHSEN